MAAIEQFIDFAAWQSGQLPMPLFMPPGMDSGISDNNDRQEQNSARDIEGFQWANGDIHDSPEKTGTTNERRDNWTIGYTSLALVVSWVGNNDNSEMSGAVSGV